MSHVRIPTIAKHRKRFNRSQVERRLERKSIDALGKLIEKFFQDSLNKDAETISINYTACEMAWQRHVSMLNKSKKPIFLMVDAFEEAIIEAGYDTARNSQVSDVRKKEIIRIITIAEKKMGGKPKWYYVWRGVKTFFVDHFFVKS